VYDTRYINYSRGIVNSRLTLIRYRASPEMVQERNPVMTPNLTTSLTPLFLYGQFRKKFPILFEIFC